MTLEQVYEAQLAWVLHTLRRLGVAEMDLDDAAHDLFVVVHRKLPGFDAARPLKPWLFGIAYRIASGRRAKARVRLAAVPDPTRRSADAGLEARAELRVVARLLDALDYNRRAVFIMHELDGFTVPEIAEAIDVPLNTAYSHLRRARRDVHDAAAQLGLLEGKAEHERA